MKTHGRHAAGQPRHITMQSSSGALRTYPLAKTAGGALVLALAVGSIGAVAAQSAGHNGAIHASGHQTVVRLEAHSHPLREVHQNFGGLSGHWMY